MAAALRSFSSTTLADRTDTTVTAPSGITDGDILLFVLHTLNDGSYIDVTLPSGFTAFAGYPTSIIESTYRLRTYIGWKVAASESGNYTATHNYTTFTQGYMLAVSGASTSTPLISTNSGTGSTTTATGITTTVNDSLVAFIARCWDGYNGTQSVPSGSTPTFTERVSAGFGYIATGVLATAGATGDKTHTNGNGSAKPWEAQLIGFQPPAASIVGRLTRSTLLRGGILAGRLT